MGGLELPDLPEVPKAKQPSGSKPKFTPKFSKFSLSFLKRKEKAAPPPEPPVPLAEISKKIERTKQDFDKDEVPKQKAAQMRKAEDQADKKQRELDQNSRLLREKDVLLQKKEKELQKWEGQLKKETVDLDAKDKGLRELERKLKDKEAQLVCREKETEKKQLDSKIIAPAVDKDVAAVLKMMDTLLEKLPESDIKAFSKSKDFALYEKVLRKNNIA
ncbi:MAG: hypothetical protein V1735_03810 [Nanoarchaeota archaeon]